MRTLDDAFRAHLESGATTLANCWRLRRRDGVVLGFTDHDVALVFEETEFLPAHGLDGGEGVQRLGLQTESTEVLGILHAEAITEDDILLGRYDGAEVECWRVNWRQPEERLLLRRLTIGEIVREGGGFRAELRSAQHALNRPQGRLYQAHCDATLGDGRCGIDLEAPEFRAEAVVSGIRDRYRLAVAGLAGHEAGWFAFGSATWSGGRRGGLVDAVERHTRLGDTDILGFAQPVGDWVVPGDALTVRAGCDRRFATCREKFGNATNFRGFPHIPGNDFLLRYPREDSDLDGQPLFR